MKDDFEKKLLTDGGKWWEFLDPESYQTVDDLPTATRSSADQLDWSRRDAMRRRGPVGHGFYVHCADCGNPVPPDFTFCVRCGGAPRSANPVMTYSLVVADLRSESAREAAVELVCAAGQSLEPAEVAAIFEDPPAVFNVTARKDQVAALVAKLSEMGIPARSFPVDSPSIPWIREGLESIARQTPKLLAAMILTLATIMASWIYSLIFLPVGLLALGGFLVRELAWYRDHYHLDIDRLLQRVTGFDAATAAQAKETLRQLSDREVQEHVTVCLMEYYALNQQLRVHEPVYGAMLENTRQALEDLMRDVLGLAHRYARVDGFLVANPPAAARQRLEALRAHAPTDAAAARLVAQEIAALEEQLQASRQMDSARAAFRERIAALATSMELMRTRVATIRARPSEEAWRAAAIDEALAELDREFEVFEETFAVVGQS